MVKKLQKMAAKQKAANGAFPGLPSGLLDSQIAQTVKDSAQQIWAAGLGAFAKAQGEGGKVYEALVKEGMSLQKKTQSAAEDRLSSVTSKMSGMASEVGARAGQHWDKLESIFEDRVASALKRLGVPTAKEIEALIARIDALGAAVGMPAQQAPKTAAKAPAKTADKAPAKKPAAKKKAAAAKKAVAGKPPVKPVVAAKKAAAARKRAPAA